MNTTDTVSLLRELTEIYKLCELGFPHDVIRRCAAKAIKALPTPVAATQPAHEEIIREGDQLTCTACGTSTPVAAIQPPGDAVSGVIAGYALRNKETGDFGSWLYPTEHRAMLAKQESSSYSGPWPLCIEIPAVSAPAQPEAKGEAILALLNEQKADVKHRDGDWWRGYESALHWISKAIPALENK